MEKLLVKGEKVVICKINDPSQQLIFDFSFPIKSSRIYDLDIFLYLFEEHGRIDKKNIVFYSNPVSLHEGVRYTEAYESNEYRKTAEINLSKIGFKINKICIACSVYVKNREDFDEYFPLELKMEAVNKTLRSPMFKSIDPIDLVHSQTIILGEIYKHRDTWKYNAIKQEMDGGLMGVLKKMYQMQIY